MFIINNILLAIIRIINLFRFPFSPTYMTAFLWLLAACLLYLLRFYGKQVSINNNSTDNPGE